MNLKFSFVLILIFVVLFSTSSSSLLKNNNIDYKWTQLKQSIFDKWPQKRMDSASCFAVIDNEPGMFMVGGHDKEYYKDAWFYSYTTSKWSQLDSLPINSTYDGLVDHSIVFSPRSKTIYVYGGAGRSHVPLNCFYKFDVLTKKWSEIKISDPKQSPTLKGHTLLHISQPTEMLIMYGGYKSIGGGSKTQLNEDIYLYVEDYYGEQGWVIPDVESYKRNKPKPRAKHIAQITPDFKKMVIFGGNVYEENKGNKGNQAVSDEIWEFDLNYAFWRKLKHNSTIKPTYNPSSGIITTVKEELSYLLIFGGSFDGFKRNNELLTYKFDFNSTSTDNWSFKNLEKKEIWPKSRARTSSAVNIHKGDMYVFGGCVETNLPGMCVSSNELWKLSIN